MVATLTTYFYIMSKGNMLLGHARGKVGSLVFSRANGKQIVRAKADVVANPQTQAQVIQRIMLNTVAQAYSKMASICDHSFQGVQKGAKSMSYFMKVNLNKLRQQTAAAIDGGAYMDECFSFSPLGSNVFVPNNYDIAKGTLPKITVVDNSDDATMAFALDTNTYAGVIEKYGLQRGDQITLLAIQGESADNLGFAFARVILDPRDENDNPLPLSTEFITNGAINKPSPRNEGDIASLAFASSKVAFGFGAAYMMAGAVIVSRKKEDDTWERSDATMVANASSSELVYDLQSAIDAFYSGGIGVESSRYLNNAGSNRIAQANNPALMAKIASALSGSTPITRGATVTLGSAGNITANVTGMVDGYDYKVALYDGSDLSNETAITDGSANISSVAQTFQGKSLVLTANGQIVDTYCSFQ